MKRNTLLFFSSILIYSPQFTLSPPPNPRSDDAFSGVCCQTTWENSQRIRLFTHLLMLRNNIKGANWQKSQDGWPWIWLVWLGFFQLLPIYIWLKPDFPVQAAAASSAGWLRNVVQLCIAKTKELIGNKDESRVKKEIQEDYQPGRGDN